MNTFFIVSFNTVILLDLLYNIFLKIFCFQSMLVFIIVLCSETIMRTFFPIIDNNVKIFVFTTKLIT